jgi:hypothetical protein
LRRLTIGAQDTILPHNHPRRIYDVLCMKSLHEAVESVFH